MADNKLDVIKQQCPTLYSTIGGGKKKINTIMWIVGGLGVAFSLAFIIAGIVTRQLYVAGIGILIAIVIPLVIWDEQNRDTSRKDYLGKIERSPGSVAKYQHLIKTANPSIENHFVVVKFKDKKEVEFWAKDEAEAKQAIAELAAYLAAAQGE